MKTALKEITDEIKAAKRDLVRRRKRVDWADPSDAMQYHCENGFIGGLEWARDSIKHHMKAKK